MENIQNYLTKYETPLNKANNERATVVSDFVVELNNERVGTKYKKLTGRHIAIKLSHLKLEDLYYFLGMCRRAKNERGSFSKCFWGALKVKT